MLTALHFVAVDVRHQARWRFRCDCGNEVERLISKVRSSVKQSHYPSCGCALSMIQRSKAPFIIPASRVRYEGQRFGKLTAVRFVSMEDGGHASWLFRCDCGNEVEKLIANVKQSPHASCGCGTYTGPGFHGHAVGNGTPEYRSWLHMRERCLDPNDRYYADYGGRGIKVCDRWLNDFPAFLADMTAKGPRKPDESLDRIDTDGDYTPDNCRWADAKQQARNRHSTRWFFYQGEWRCLTDLRAFASVPYATFLQRLNRGWPVDRALHEPTYSDYRRGMRGERTGVKGCRPPVPVLVVVDTVNPKFVE